MQWRHSIRTSATGTAPVGHRRDRLRRGTGQRLLMALLMVGVLVTAATPARAAQAGWAEFTFTGTSQDYSGTMQQSAAGFPAATYTSDSVGGGVGVQTGATTFLPPQTPVGQKYGSSQGRQYLSLRPADRGGPRPSVTTYTFDRPTPDSGWTFVLGDIDADKVQITAAGADGRAVSSADLGFRSAFNYCAPGVSPKPGCGPPNNSGTDLPNWNPATGVLDGHPQDLDTAGASAWFEPRVALTSITFTYTRDAGFPIFQTWFSALQYDLTGTVSAPPGSRGGITVQLYDAQGNLLASTRTDGDGRYGFPGYATYGDYQVVVTRPVGLISDEPLSRSVDLSAGDATADFALRAVVPVEVGGTVRDADGTPVRDVQVTLTDRDGGETATTRSAADGTYVFEDVPVGDDHTLTATAPSGTTVSGPRTFSVPPDSETPITGQDFVVTEIPSGVLSGTVTEGDGAPRAGVLVTVTGDDTSRTARTDDDGSWQMADLPWGTYAVTVSPPAGTTVVGSPTRSVTLSADDPRASVDFALQVTAPATFTARGTVRDQAGPVAGVDVTITSPTGERDAATTDTRGVWSIGGLEAGAGYTAEVDVPDGYDPVEPLTFDVVGTTTGLDFILTPTDTPSPSPSAPSSDDPTPAPSETADPAVPEADPAPGAGGLAETGGPAVGVGLLGLLLAAAGIATIATGARGRRGR